MQDCVAYTLLGVLAGPRLLPCLWETFLSLTFFLCRNLVTQFESSCLLACSRLREQHSYILMRVQSFVDSACIFVAYYVSLMTFLSNTVFKKIYG